MINLSFILGSQDLSQYFSLRPLRHDFFLGGASGVLLLMGPLKDDYHNQFPFLSHRLLIDIPSLERR